MLMHTHLHTPVHMHLHTPTYTPGHTNAHSCTHLHAHLHTPVHMHLHTPAHTCTHLCTHLCTCTCTHICIHSCTHTCIYTCTHLCTYTCTGPCTHTCTHTHMPGHLRGTTDHGHTVTLFIGNRGSKKTSEGAGEEDTQGERDTEGLASPLPVTEVASPCTAGFSAPTVTQTAAHGRPAGPAPRLPSSVMQRRPRGLANVPRPTAARWVSGRPGADRLGFSLASSLLALPWASDPWLIPGSLCHGARDPERVSGNRVPGRGCRRTSCRNLRRSLYPKAPRI